MLAPLSIFAVGLALPARLKPSTTSPTPVVTGGGDTSHVLYGKLQRAATLPGTRLSPNPIAAVEAPRKLGSVLWSQFMMSSVAPSYSMDRDDLTRTRRLEESLLIIDCTSPEGGSSGGGLPNPFAGLFGTKPRSQADGIVDRELLSVAEARAVTHVYVLLDGDEAALGEFAAALAPLALRATLIAPEAGVTLATTDGWRCGEVQDHEGELQQGLAVRSGIEPPPEAKADDEGAEAPPPPPPTAPAVLLPSPAGVASAGASLSLAREDFAELTLQTMLRCARTADEGAPALRVLRVAPGGGGGGGSGGGGAGGAGELTERARNNYDANFGAKSRKRLGTVNSADWTALLAPFGVVRKSDPDDWRNLISVDYRSRVSLLQ